MGEDISEKINLTFFSTRDCHLCEEAMTLLQQSSLVTRDCVVEYVDIASSEELVEEYGIRIPVVKRDVSEDVSELGWPFDLDRLEAFIQDYESRKQ